MNWLGLLLSTGRLPSNSGEHKGDNKNAKFEHQMAPLRNLACGARIVVILMFLFVVASLVSALVHEKSKRILNMKQQEKYANALVLPAMMDQAKHYWSQAKEGLQLRRLSSKESKLDAEAADRYFEAQLPHFKKSMQGYPLHSHFANIQLPSKISFHDMIKARGELLVRQLEENGWEDFKIEKDKCAMFQFLKYNGLPHVDWLEIYRGFNDLESVLPKIRKQLLDQKDFPMFIKSCHITTGAAKSVRKVASRQEVEENWGTLSEWAQNMWSYRSNDWERIWAKPFNILCGALKPGFMVQHPWKVGRQEFPEEIKVEVIWGRAYLAFVSTGKCGGDTIILRDGSVTRYTDSLMQNVLHQGKPDPCYRWIVDEGHLPRYSNSRGPMRFFLVKPFG